MLEELLKNTAFAELYKNAPTYNVNGNHTQMGSSIPLVPPPTSIPVINSLQNIIPTKPNNNGNSKKVNKVVFVIALSIVGGILVINVMNWWDDYQNKKNNKV